MSQLVVEIYIHSIFTGLVGQGRDVQLAVAVIPHIVPNSFCCVHADELALAVLNYKGGGNGAVRVSTHFQQYHKERGSLVRSEAVGKVGSDCVGVIDSSVSVAGIIPRPAFELVLPWHLSYWN